MSLALRSDPQISLSTRKRVLAAVERTGYTVNPVVSHLMAELRRSRSRTLTHTLALVNAYRLRDAFLHHPIVPDFVSGCKRRAVAQGYGIDTFWLHDPDLDGKRFNRILRSRGICGVIVIGT